MLSNTGTWSQNVAVQWLVYQQTGSATWGAHPAGRPGGVFALNAASYVAVLVALGLLRLPAREARVASVAAQLIGDALVALGATTTLGALAPAAGPAASR